MGQGSSCSGLKIGEFKKPDLIFGADEGDKETCSRFLQDQPMMNPAKP